MSALSGHYLARADAVLSRFTRIAANQGVPLEQAIAHVDPSLASLMIRDGLVELVQGTEPTIYHAQVKLTERGLLILKG